MSFWCPLLTRNMATCHSKIRCTVKGSDHIWSIYLGSTTSNHLKRPTSNTTSYKHIMNPGRLSSVTHHYKLALRHWKICKSTTVINLHRSFTDVKRLPRTFIHWLCESFYTTVVVTCVGYAWHTLLAKCEWRDADQAGPGLPSNQTFKSLLKIIVQQQCETPR